MAVVGKRAVWIIKAILVVGILCLAARGAYDSFPYFYRVVWKCAGIELPITSGHYRIALQNQAARPIVVDVYNINDRAFRSETPQQRIRRMQWGEILQYSAMLPAGDTAVAELPSVVDWTMGMLLVVARTPVQDPALDFELRQDVAMYLLEPKDVILKGQDLDSPPLLRIRDGDFMEVRPQLGLPPDQRLRGVLAITEVMAEDGQPDAAD